MLHIVLKPMLIVTGLLLLPSGGNLRPFWKGSLQLGPQRQQHMEQSFWQNNSIIYSNQLLLEKVKRQKAVIISTLCLFAITVISLHYRNLKTRRQKLRALRQQMARDIHDSVGTSLSNIGLLAALIERQIEDGDTTKSGLLLHRMIDELNVTHQDLDDIIDNLRTPYYSLPELLSRMTRYAYEMLQENQVNLSLFIADPVRSLALNEESRRFLCLVFRESIHNIVKHAEATSVEVELKSDRDFLYCSVKDNGIGFLPGVDNAGNGLINMEKRMALLNGRFEVHTLPGHGTRLQFALPLHGCYSIPRPWPSLQLSPSR